MNWLSNFPDEEWLLQHYPAVEVMNVNAHVHTPYSFSAFSNMEQLFSMAVHEKIAVLGINDFFVTGGYESFCREALKNQIFPLFNIEFISLLKEQQRQNIRINDPNNPGRCYFCGKGLDYPFNPDAADSEKLDRTIALSQEQIRAMIGKLNVLFTSLGSGISFDFDTVRTRYAMDLVRERHLAAAVRDAVFENSDDDASKFAFFIRLYDGKSPKCSMNDISGLENEIRSNLLKSGGKAYVEEDEATFPALNEIINIITHAGGIPCYPVLLDDKDGNYTEFEKTYDTLHQGLQSWQVKVIELIPGRNDAVVLQKFVTYFHEKGYVILMGTEHNSPGMIPLTCDTRGKEPLTENMRKIACEGVCVIAAHQYKRAKGLTGFQDSDEKAYFFRLGNAVIQHNRKIKTQ